MLHGVTKQQPHWQWNYTTASSTNFYQCTYIHTAELDDSFYAWNKTV